jgi:D-glycero-alpha-D-manno-heptose 1-phosphate guanylyltransferase
MVSMPEPVDAIILCGGRGTRLAAIVSDVPKPLALVSGRPFLDYILDHLAASGLVRRAVLAIGHMAERIVAHYGQCRPPLPLSFVHETEPLGTAGALINALPATASDPVLGLNGDSLFRFDVRTLLRHHLDSGAEATLALVIVPDSGRYGSVELCGSRVVAFREKETANRPGPINGGVMVLSRKLLDRPVRPLSVERELLPAAIERGTLQGIVFETPFLDIGLPESFAVAPEFLRSFQDRQQGKSLLDRRLR